MIKFFIMVEPDLAVLAYNMTKFMNGIQRNGGVVISTHIMRDVNPLLSGIVFYSETKKERVTKLNTMQTPAATSAVAAAAAAEEVQYA